jgi:hypothetical protein
MDAATRARSLRSRTGATAVRHGRAENRLVARSLERAWEDKLRAAEAIEKEYARWHSEEPVVICEAERAALQRLGENLPKIWRANTTSAADRKRILRLDPQHCLFGVTSGVNFT